jgi:uncharacterized membrane protein YfcA
MAGGVALLSIMTFFFTVESLIPIHGVAQLGANSFRTVLLRKDLKWDIFLPFILGIPFGVVLAIFLLKDIISNDATKIFLAIMICYVIFRPKKMPELKIANWAFVIVGIISGVLGILVGSVGPFLAAFFVRDDYKKEEVVATKSSMQMVTHLSKIPTFWYLDFNYAEHSTLIISLIACVFLGSLIGVKILKRINQKVFKILFKTALFFAAIRLIATSV